MQQALDYGITLDIPFVFSSNGHGFVLHDRTGTSLQLETRSRWTLSPAHPSFGHVTWLGRDSHLRKSRW
jgi:type I site-specific restriction endonuclease